MSTIMRMIGLFIILTFLLEPFGMCGWKYAYEERRIILDPLDREFPHEREEPRKVQSWEIDARRTPLEDQQLDEEPDNRTLTRPRVEEDRAVIDESNNNAIQSSPRIKSKSDNYRGQDIYFNPDGSIDVWDPASGHYIRQ